MWTTLLITQICKGTTCVGCRVVLSPTSEAPGQAWSARGKPNKFAHITHSPRVVTASLCLLLPLEYCGRRYSTFFVPLKLEDTHPQSWLTSFFRLD